jgi:hypothetical protein
MDDRNYYIRISPEVILSDINKVPYFAGQLTTYTDYQICCKTYKSPVITNITGETYVYSSMTALLSGATGTNDKGIDVTKNVSKATHKLGTSLLTGMTIPILLTENTVDLGYYSVFDGMIVQKDVMTNFIFSASPVSAMTVYFYNTSDTEFKKYLEFSEYKLDWGDPGMPGKIILNPAITMYSHTYSQPSPLSGYTISLSGMSPWGSNVVKKTVHVPYSNVVIGNPNGTINGTAYFTPSGGNWSGTSFMYDFIFSGDSSCDTTVKTIGNFTTVPFLITGYTQSSLNDIKQYGAVPFPTHQSLTGVSGSYGEYYGITQTNGISYTGYSVNGITYHDFSDGTTIFLVQSSGLTSDMVVCSAITKNEVLLNVIDEPEVQSNVFVERGKQSSLESIERLGEVDNIGDLTKYGYKFFNIIKT